MTLFQLINKQLLGLLLGYACNQFAYSHEITTLSYMEDEEHDVEGEEDQWVITTLIVVGFVSMIIVLSLCMLAFCLSSPRVQPPEYGIDASKIPSSPVKNLVQYEAQPKVSGQCIATNHQGTSQSSANNPFVNILMTGGEKRTPQPIIPSIVPEFPRDVKYARSNRFKKAVHDRRKRDLFETILRKTKRLNKVQTKPSLCRHSVEVNFIMNKNYYEASRPMVAENDQRMLRDPECDNMANKEMREVDETHSTQQNDEYISSQKSLVVYDNKI